MTTLIPDGRERLSLRLMAVAICDVLRSGAAESAREHLAELTRASDGNALIAASDAFGDDMKELAKAIGGESAERFAEFGREVGLGYAPRSLVAESHTAGSGREHTREAALLPRLALGMPIVEYLKRALDLPAAGAF